MVTRLDPAGHETALLRALRGFTSSLCHRRKQHIVAKKVDTGASPPGGTVPEAISDVKCFLVEAAAAPRDGEIEMPPSMRDSLEDLESRLGEGCLVFLASRSRAKGAGQEVVGYCICERGIFSALGRKMTISPDILFTHHIEVIPEYRGRGVADVIRGRIDEHCRANGITTRCGVISLSKIPSLTSSLRAGFRVVGAVRHVSLLNGLIVWNTPWKKVEKILQQVDVWEIQSE